MSTEDLLMNTDNTSLDEIIKKIVNLRDQKNNMLVEKYNIKWLISEFEGEKINFLEKKFNEFGNQGLDIIDFCTAFL
jgi:hypothetical protein